MDMTIEIDLDGTPLIDIARTIGVAPCQIIHLNGVRTETELMEMQRIKLPINVEHLVTPI